VVSAIGAQVFLGKSLADGKLYAVKHINRANLRKKKFTIKSDAVRALIIITAAAAAAAAAVVVDDAPISSL
jgi:hypothetical protein